MIARRREFQPRNSSIRAFPTLARRRTSCYRILVGPVSTRIEDLRRERGTLLMGVLNVTPDSFFDGGRYDDGESAAQRIDQLLADGADLIDIGAESTRPGAAAIPADEQIARLEPALRYAAAERRIGLGRHGQCRRGSLRARARRAPDQRRVLFGG